MGATIVLPEELKTFNKHAGRQHLPSKRLDILPESRKVCPGSLVTFHRALPPGVRFLDRIPDNLYWWPDVVFVPHSERSLVVSVGAYLSRPGTVPLIACARTHGLLYTMTYGDRITCSIIKGTSVSCRPNVNAYPSGNTIAYTSNSYFTVLNLTSLWTSKRENDARTNNFKYSAFAPNGNYIATMAACSRSIELETFLIDSRHFLKQDWINCHHVCPGFRTELYNPAAFQCKFSPDSQYIACASSKGQLFVVSRYQLKKQCNIIPEIFKDSTIQISNERTFDFDPRCLHKHITFADMNGMVYICNIDDNIISIQYDLSTESNVQCLKYDPTGRTLAIALSDGTIHLHDPDTLDRLYKLDATNIQPDAQMVKTPQGDYPTLIHMSYSSTGDLLATSSTDGLIRIWQLKPDLSLQQLCRRAILQRVKMTDVFKLPLPGRLISFILQWPEC